jgi:hypothetical protein
VDPSPAPLEAYAAAFDDLFGRRNQLHCFRRHLERLLPPAQRRETPTGLANTEPVAGPTHPRAQDPRWSLSESARDPGEVNARRLGSLRSGPATAHVGRQYLANLGKIDGRVVSVTGLWADERVYRPAEYEPHAPARRFGRGEADPDFRTKPGIAVELVGKAVASGIPLGAVVADSFYGENRGFRRGLEALGAASVLALKPSHSWGRYGRRPWPRGGNPRSGAAAWPRSSDAWGTGTRGCGGRWRSMPARTAPAGRGGRWWRRPTPRRRPTRGCGA